MDRCCRQEEGKGGEMRMVRQLGSDDPPSTATEE
jgi:hypothetical protein